MSEQMIAREIFNAIDPNSYEFTPEDQSLKAARAVHGVVAETVAELTEALAVARSALDKAQREIFELAGYGENETDAAMADFVTANEAFRKIDAALAPYPERR